MAIMRSHSLLCVVLVATGLAACEQEAPPAPAPSARPQAAVPSGSGVVPASVPAAKAPQIDPADIQNFKVLPAKFESEKNAITEEKVTLGRMLFYEPRLSKNHDIACNSCHDLQSYGVDNKKFSSGHKGQLGGRNSPTVYNAAGHIAQFWDGRAPTIEEQAKGPILNPVEMAMPKDAKVIEKLKSIPQYIDLFKKAFPDDKDPVTYDNLAKAIGAFERQLVTPAKFDKYLAGDKSALNEKETAGLAKFIKLGCPTCHTGAAVGGSSFQKLGLVKPYPDTSDLGRFDVTKQEADKMFFRVPSLRNVVKTGPYFHNGSIEKLEDVVRTMARHQLGVELKDDEVDVLLAFLGSLVGEIPAAYIKKPELPPDGPKTAKPDPT
jgi:cytochrome c peroxidase